MTPQELKSSILQLAVQGKLVEQRPDEGTAEELYQQIQEEKQRLIKEGKIKKEKPLPEITEDEIPFDIPESWKWVRLGTLLHKLVDGTHRTPKYTTSGIPFVSVRNMSNGKLSLQDTKFISEEEHKELWTRCNPQKGDLLLSKVGTTGVPAIVDTDIEFSLFVSVALLKFNNDLLHIDFLVYSILAPDFQKQCNEHTRGVGNKNWVIKDIANTILPLPPLAEQKRIVAKIEELLPYIDRYEKAWSKLEDFNKRFPGDMQKSVLQMAIQGKLVEQRPEEGTAEELYQQIQEEKQRLIKEGKIKKEKPLPEITDDEIPFDIPESWKWARMAEVIDVRDGTHDTPKYVTNGVPLVTSKNLVYGRIDFESTKLISHQDAEMINMRSAVNDNDILFAMIGTIGNPVLVKKDREFAIKNMALFKAINKQLFNMNYLLLFLSKEQHEMKKKASGGVQSFVSLKFLRNYLIPLPPLAEQKRIVEKLEEILPLCEKLK